MGDNSDSDEESAYFRAELYRLNQNVHFEIPNTIPKEKCNFINTLQNREYGILMTKHKQAKLITSYNSFWLKKYFLKSLSFVQSLSYTSKLEEHISSVHSVDFDNSGNYLCSAGTDSKVAIWNWRENNLKYIYCCGHSLKVRQCKWTTDCQAIVTCSDDSTVRVASIHPEAITSSRVVCTHQAPVNCIAFCEQNVLLSGSEDSCVNQIDLRERSSRELFSIRKRNHPLAIYSIDCNQCLRPNLFAISGEGPTVRMYDRRLVSKNKNVPFLTFKPDCSSDSKTLSVTCVQYCPDANKLLASYNSGELYIFDIKSKKASHKLIGHWCRPILNKCCWFGEQFVFSTSNDGYLYAWDIDTEHVVFYKRADEVGNVNSITIHPYDPVIATGGSNCAVKVWSPKDGHYKPFDYASIRKKILKNLIERQVYDHYCSFLDDLEEMKTLSSIRNLFEETVELCHVGNEDYETFEELECIPV